VISLLDVKPSEEVLEVGFGPGLGIQLLANSARRVAGVDCSREMVQQAKARNAEAIASGVVDLRDGSVEDLPFEDGTFDAVLAINSMQGRDTGTAFGCWFFRSDSGRDEGRILRPCTKAVIAAKGGKLPPYG
jgi:SAM-dependent methyltransferase